MSTAVYKLTLIMYFIFLSICTVPAAIPVELLVAFLVCLIFLIIGVITGVLAKWIHLRKETLPQRNGNPPNKSQNVDPTEAEGATEEEEDTKNHVYAFVCVESSNERQGAAYQGLDIGDQDYVGMYAQLRREVYEELSTRAMRDTEEAIHTF